MIKFCDKFFFICVFFSNILCAQFVPGNKFFTFQQIPTDIKRVILSKILAFSDYKEAANTICSLRFVNTSFSNLMKEMNLYNQMIRKICDGQKYPLHRAVERNELEIVKLLIKNNIDIHGKSKHGRTPLHVAALKGHKEMVSLLLKCGANINARGSEGITPLHVAVIYNYKDVVDLLLKKGANVNVCTIFRRTPISYAAQLGYLEIVKLLLEYKADIEYRDFDDKTAFNYAVDGDHKEHKEIVKVLLRTLFPMPS